MKWGEVEFIRMSRYGLRGSSPLAVEGERTLELQSNTLYVSFWSPVLP